MRQYTGITFAIFLCSPTCGATIQCPKFLHVGDEEICLSPFKQTNPSLAVQINDTIYFAATSTEPKGKLKFEYMGNNYSVYNYEYELIHWLSGEDTLVNGIWHDRMATSTSDNQALNFTAIGDIKHTVDNGYYSEDGKKAYFYTDYIPDINFGTDWYIEMVFDLRLANADKNGYFIDMGFVSTCIESPTDTAFPPYSFGLNIAVDQTNAFGFQPGYIYQNGGKITYRFGVKKYDATKSTAYQIADDILLIGHNFTTRTFQTKQSSFLFRLSYIEDLAASGTIYDIKVYRKKTN